MAPRDDLTHLYISQPVHLQRNIGGELVTLAQITFRVVTDGIYQILLVE